MNEAVDLIQLSGFSSLFEVAVGINLVFSAWNSLRDNALNKFNKRTDNHRITLQAKLGDKYDNSRCSVKFDTKVLRYKNNLENLSKCAKWGGMIISSLLLILLMYLGFDPNFSLTSSQCLIISLISVLPSALFLFLGQLYVGYANTSLESFMEQQTDAVADWENVYGDVGQ
ncbi:hypothetical protein [Photobacterium leiognathi]|uniref:hypothetical protein n=1 Tax=Photobacterium leiognathi TaxID=553611 RepID=UPI00076A0620|nr:hypothetical protein [Photobacterium leiognathi]